MGRFNILDTRVLCFLGTSVPFEILYSLLISSLYSYLYVVLQCSQDTCHVFTCNRLAFRQSPPLTVRTLTDRSGIVLIGTASGLTFTLISLLIKVFIRLDIRNQFARDDVVVAIAMVGLHQMDSHNR